MFRRLSKARPQETVMARVTIEDCLDAVQNRFAIAMIAARRARQLAAGAEPLVESTNKHNVHALREIAAGKIGFDRDVDALLATWEKGSGPSNV